MKNGKNTDSQNDTAYTNQKAQPLPLFRHTTNI